MTQYILHTCVTKKTNESVHTHTHVYTRDKLDRVDSDRE